MFSFETLDVLIGLATLYMMFGIACTAAVEAFSSLFRIRSRNLEAALSEMFSGHFQNGSAFVDQFYAHPLIRCLSKGATGRPSYIPPALVSRVAESVLLTHTATQNVNEAINALPGTPQTHHLKGLLNAIADHASNDTESFRLALENQFDAVMDRASGWYKRHTQRVSLITATVLVLSANIDSIDIAAQLSKSPAALKQTIELAQHQLTQPGLPFGWRACPENLADWLSKIIGLMTSIFAISLGAPFWFALLQRFMQVRAAGLSPNDKGKT